MHVVYPISATRSRGVIRLYWVGEDCNASERFGREETHRQKAELAHGSHSCRVNRVRAAFWQSGVATFRPGTRPIAGGKQSFSGSGNYACPREVTGIVRRAKFLPPPAHHTGSLGGSGCSGSVGGSGGSGVGGSGGVGVGTLCRVTWSPLSTGSGRMTSRPQDCTVVRNSG